jgi:hypothetical protein
MGAAPMARSDLAREKRILAEWSIQASRTEMKIAALWEGVVGVRWTKSVLKSDAKIFRGVFAK